MCRKKLSFLFCLICIIASCSKQEPTTENQRAYILELISHSKNTSLTTQQRRDSIDKAYLMVADTGGDTLKKKVLRQAVNLYKWHGDKAVFHRYAQEHMYIATFMKDSAGLARTTASRGLFHKLRNEYDSAYYYNYRGHHMFQALKDSVSIGICLLNIAILHKNVRDYEGSEIYSYQAIDYLKNTNNIKSLSSVYNNLGIVYNQWKEWREAIAKHEKAYELREEYGSEYLKLQSYNNIGKVYKDSGNYQKAKQYFEDILSNETFTHKKGIQLRAATLDNYAHTRMLDNDTIGVLTDLYKAMEMRKGIDDEDGIVINSIHLAEYYKSIDSLARAKQFALRAKDIAERIQSYRDYLVSLDLLAILTEGKEKERYIHRRHVVDDSLKKESRKHANTFARVRHDLDAKETTISQQQKRITILGVAVSALLIITAFIVVRKRREKKFLQEELFEHKRDLEELTQSSDEIDERSIKLIQSATSFHDYLMKKFYNRLEEKHISLWEAIYDGLSQKQLAEKFHMSVDTVKKYKKHLYSAIKIEKHVRNKNRIAAEMYRNERIAYTKYKREHPHS